MNVLRLYIQVFLRQTGMSPKKWLFYPFMITIFASIWLFYGFIADFQAYYINELKGVYPEYFLVTNGIAVTSPDDSLVHKAETFEVSTSFNFSFSPDSEIVTLLNVGVRAAEFGAISVIDFKDDPAEDVVFLSSSIYQKISTSPEFRDNSLTLETYKGDRFKVTVQPFKLFGGKGWVVLSTRLAKRLGIVQNVNAVYPQGPMTESFLKKKYAANGQQLSVWHERIPFSSAVFYKILFNMYVVLVSAVLILALVLSFGVVTDIVAEISRLIRLSLLYGVSFYSSVFCFFCICIINVFTIYGCSSFLKDAVRVAVSPAIPEIGENYSIGMSLIEVYSIFVFCLFMSFVVVYRRYRKPEIIFGQ